MNLKFILSWLFIVLLFTNCNTSSKNSNSNSKANENVSNEKLSSNDLLNSKNFAFPNGKLKCLVISFDDGPEHDRLLVNKLNKANMVGTFHLNSARLGKRAEWLSSELGNDIFFVSEKEIKNLYFGHEISSHTTNHVGLNNQNDSLIKFEVSSDIDKLEELVGKPVKGLAYPFGAYDNQTLKSLQDLNIKYARTTASTQTFELPKSNFLTLNPTCHIFDAVNFGSFFVNNDPKEMQLLNIWGHSYEFHNNWELADSICNVLGNKKDIWYAKTIELVEYLEAIKQLKYTNKTVFNPSKEISVWIKNTNGNFVELQPEQRMPIDFKSSYQKVNTIDSLYPKVSTSIKYHGDWTKINYKNRIAEFKNSPLNFGDIVFVGNSITEKGGDWSKKFNMPNIRNRGIAGDVTDGVLERINEITHYKPKAVFLLIGINDLFNLHYQKEIPSVKYVANNIIKITEIIHKKSPETKIYLQTILPTSEAYMADNINSVNTIIKNYENEAHYELIDLFNVFVDSNGLIKPSLTVDGTHLNELGYELWVKTIKNKLK
jgi:lysophospholipase L1-like esterase/peptidoglycan/xylan/chitin deacetylase (PgdA/CDA1 family)